MNTKIHFNNVEMAKPVEDGGYLTLKRGMLYNVKF